MLTRTQRLETLPVTPKLRRIMGASGIGWALDAMDVGLISFIIAALGVHWKISPTEQSWLVSAGFIGMAAGASLGGLLADKIGRKQVFALTLLVYGLATGASALATGLVMLIILRFIIGMGLGAELPVASTLIAEFSPRMIRARMIVILEAFWAVGWIFAALIGAYVIKSGPDGWRWALALGMIPAFYSLVIRMGLPESVAFLESKERYAEAEAVVRDFESSARSIGWERADNMQSDFVDEKPKPVVVTSIWASGLRKRSAALWTIWFFVNFSYYGAFIWIPTLLVAAGFDLVRSFSFTLIITLAQLPGYAVAAWLIEKWGRRSTLTVFLIGSAFGAGFYALANTPATIIAAGCVLSFFNLGAWGALYAIGPDLYPTHLRGVGTGSAAAFGRVASILTPLLVPVVVASLGTLWLFVIFAAAFFIAAAAAWLLPEQKGTELS